MKTLTNQSIKIKLLICIALLGTVLSGNAQTNSFPATGNAGVGTSSPATNFEIAGSTNGSSNNSWINFDVTATSNPKIFSKGWSASLDLYTYTTQGSPNLGQLHLNSNGNVGIGTTGIPSGKLSIYYPYNVAPTLASSVFAPFILNNAGTEITMGVDSNAPFSSWLQTRNNSVAWNLAINPLGGNVGIGTTSPKGQLHLASDGDHSLLISRADGTFGFRIFRNAQGGNVYFQIGSATNVWETKIQIGEGEGVNTRLLFNPNGGNVGIGTTTPQNKLDVNGTIRAKEVKVETGWADFVFAPTYKLRPLAEVEQFIKTNGHLPEIPKAEDVQQNGVNLGEMQTKLLQKVEELTLYSIEQNKQLLEQRQLNADMQKQLTAQSQENAEIKKELEELKELLNSKIK